MRQLLTESLLISMMAGIAAVVLAQLAARLTSAAVAALPTPVPLGLAFTIDWPLVAVSLGLAGGTALTFGLVPALQSSRTDVLVALKEGAIGAGPTRSRLRAIFMTVQVAMSALLARTKRQDHRT